MARYHITKKMLILNKTGGRCAYCGCPLTLRNMTVDHIVPKVEGGSNYIDNLTPACPTCNVMKGRLSVVDFVIGVRRVAQKVEKDIAISARKHRAAIRSTRECVLHYKKLTATDFLTRRCRV